MFADKGEYFFSLHEPATRSSQWVGLKESGQPFFVESYDQAKGAIQVKYRDQVMTLTLKLAQIIVQAAPSPGGPPTAPPGGPALANTAASNEATRLAQVAEEIRRRRALRAPQGPVPMPAPAGSPPQSGPVPQPNAPGSPPSPGPIPTKP